ncbi:SDR family oxidoreductase [Aspergillus brunneoviolaceus CBS 621.78]|uniref:Aflatoxin biosynthesis ketoreductase nor-1 n=1 Tax=Aspergillus brunneoviolaceus CBS 621.78 TaxID=1450534 RepID=A0ACD1FZ51_9EURO|nr:aflatoxin biosynthesis ketoreductase nor-1 [Aspergillus brunneoviolaceus CBS 621.78]RAH42282.1 aflatoxin biosynthesis ketoreductase nor-1 [Aspergillus brunneoviolaceus CBS 621.78]
MTSTVYLITGASRGIGHGLARILVSRPNCTVIAAVRDPSAAAAHTLLALPAGEGSRLILVKIDAQSDTDAHEAVRYLQEAENIHHLDVVVANAGYYDDDYRLEDVPLSKVQRHLDVNTVGILRLFQAVFKPLGKSSQQQQQQPKFVTISSFMGSIAGLDEEYFPGGGYGASKAAANWITRKIHVENPGFVSFMIHPGFVKTAMGNAAARSIGLDSAFSEVDECADGIVKLIDGATRESVGGRFVTVKGQEMAF